MPLALGPPLCTLHTVDLNSFGREGFFWCCLLPFFHLPVVLICIPFTTCPPTAHTPQNMCSEDETVGRS